MTVEVADSLVVLLPRVDEPLGDAVEVAHAEPVGLAVSVTECVGEAVWVASDESSGVAVTVCVTVACCPDSPEQPTNRGSSKHPIVAVTDVRFMLLVQFLITNYGSLQASLRAAVRQTMTIDNPTVAQRRPPVPSNYALLTSLSSNLW